MIEMVVSPTLGGKGQICRGIVTMRCAHWNKQTNPRVHKPLIAIVIYSNHVIIGKSSRRPSHL